MKYQNNNNSQQRRDAYFLNMLDDVKFRRFVGVAAGK